MQADGDNAESLGRERRGKKRQQARCTGHRACPASSRLFRRGGTGKRRTRTACRVSIRDCRLTGPCKGGFAMWRQAMWKFAPFTKGHGREERVGPGVWASLAPQGKRENRTGMIGRAGSIGPVVLVSQIAPGRAAARRWGRGYSRLSMHGHRHDRAHVAVALAPSARPEAGRGSCRGVGPAGTQTVQPTRHKSCLVEFPAGVQHFATGFCDFFSE